MTGDPYRSSPRIETRLPKGEGPWTELTVALLVGWFMVVGNQPSGSWMSLGGLVAICVPVLGCLAVLITRARRRRDEK
jgi:hypothetical protein